MCCRISLITTIKKFIGIAILKLFIIPAYIVQIEYLLLCFCVLKFYCMKLADNKEEFRLNSKLKNDSTDYLFKAVLSLDNEEECYRFFEDLCTSAELKAMSQRLVVAKMLKEKKVYTEIVRETGASTATISRVKRALFDNDTYGYTMVLDKLADGDEN